MNDTKQLLLPNIQTAFHARWEHSVERYVTVVQFDPTQSAGGDLISVNQQNPTFNFVEAPMTKRLLRQPDQRAQP